MTREELATFLYEVSPTRIRLDEVPERFRPYLVVYREAYANAAEIWGENNPESHKAGKRATLAALNPQPKHTRGNCPKCGGRGRLRGFAHIKNGVCFTCGGSGNVGSK